ncbi:MAG: PhnD/SsuA/transferrin family substrate-binding protein [Candidatus Anammoxibacter sp.]
MNECKNHQSQIANHKSRRIVLILFCASIFLPLLSETSSVYASPDHICAAYFYNPESNVDNFASLKSTMDQYFKKSGNCRFQPFVNKEVFEKQFRGNQNALVIISSWHFNCLKKENGIKPVLVGVIDGKTTQKKILSAKKNISDVKMLEGARIASAGSDEYTRNLLKQMLGRENEKLVDSFQLLVVPKDIDALISVGFGLADAALTTENSLDMLSSINPRLRGKLVTVASSKEILLPIIAIHEGLTPDIVKLLVALRNMPDSKEGNKGMQILGLDGWKRFDEQDKELLK